MLDVDKSLFVDFQKVRIQETQSELPRGCIPRSVEIILRAETVEAVQVFEHLFIYFSQHNLKNIYNNTTA